MNAVTFLKSARLTLPLLLFACSGISQTTSPHFAKGVEQYKKAGYDAATKSFAKSIEDDPACVDCYIYKDLCLLMAGKYQEAYDFSCLAIKKFPTTGDFYFYRGTIIHATGDMYAAQDDANMAIKYTKTDSTLDNAYLLRVGVKMALRNFDGAIDDCKILLAKDSLHKGALTNLSLAYSDQGKMDESIELMKKVIKLDSTYIEGIGNLGYLLNLKGEYKEAKKYLDMGLRMKTAPIRPYLLSNRGYAQLKLGDTKAALKDVTESISLMPQNSYAYRNLGLIYLEMKDVAKACTSFNNAIQKGFTEMYGEEVKELIKQNCSN